MGTKNAYQSALTVFCDWIKDNKLGDIRGADMEMALKFLRYRQPRVSQKTLDLDRQALSLLLHRLDGVPVRIERIESTCTCRRLPSEEKRAYTRIQMLKIAHSLPYRSRLAVEIAYASGLRSKELLTLRKADERPESNRRKWTEQRFKGRNGVRYTVKGKGGLAREVMVPYRLSDQLEKLRLDHPKWITDRKIHYQTQYAIPGGNKLSQQFSQKSKELLDWSGGLHGLRHSYVQNRMRELKRMKLSESDAKKIVSQEVGHFRTSILNDYLR